MEKMISHSGVGNLPAKEPEVYKLIQFERDREPLHPDSKFPGSTCILFIQLWHGGTQGCSAEQTAPWGHGFSRSCIGCASCATLSFGTAEAA